jgi:hypothetical protein
VPFIKSLKLKSCVESQRREEVVRETVMVEGNKRISCALKGLKTNNLRAYSTQNNVLSLIEVWPQRRGGIEANSPSASQKLVCLTCEVVVGSLL